LERTAAFRLPHFVHAGRIVQARRVPFKFRAIASALERKYPPLRCAAEEISPEG
jgi:hypothetical protein